MFLPSYCIVMVHLHTFYLPFNWPNSPVPLSLWPSTHTGPSLPSVWPLAKPLPSLLPAPPPSSCAGVRLVGGSIDQRGACLPRSPPPRTTRHQTPPPLPPKPEWVPAMCILTHEGTLLPALTTCIAHPTSIHPGPTPWFLRAMKVNVEIILFSCFVLFFLRQWQVSKKKKNLSICSQRLSFHSFREQEKMQKQPMLHCLTPGRLTYQLVEHWSDLKTVAVR